MYLILQVIYTDDLTGFCRVLALSGWRWAWVYLFLIIIDKNILQLHLIRLGWDDSQSYVFC